jgi:hypothetical protein
VKLLQLIFSLNFFNIKYVFQIWVTGLEGICRERATACVSRGGGVRYDCPHERVTHIVSGNKAAASAALTALPEVPVLSPLWLVKSVEAGKALDEIEVCFFAFTKSRLFFLP